ncbi:hypothetical protein CICLE_v10006372mg [Citrus x clementina]|uniref:Uncharacterized protein n=1 Tax=Citrus clementina TaxID=85681 RepID=V4RL34_CITCL|nr:hypothetical protein CICLE_v10006372mg [Citrus x clementina]
MDQMCNTTDHKSKFLQGECITQSNQLCTLIAICEQTCKQNVVSYVFNESSASIALLHSIGNFNTFDCLDMQK